ncbi:hypothetical protein L0152_22160 [bacterium]|nr:hypothetical protein [bacterium]
MFEATAWLQVHGQSENIFDTPNVISDFSPIATIILVLSNKVHHEIVTFLLAIVVDNHHQALKPRRNTGI